jgi:hypothetical protein
MLKLIVELVGTECVTLTTAELEGLEIWIEMRVAEIERKRKMESGTSANCGKAG